MVSFRGLRLLVLALALGAGLDANAQLLRPPRLPLAPAAPLPRDGTYIANDEVRFVTDHRYGYVRLRFADSEEVFYLTSEAAPLSGRVLKYDTGAVALQVTGWGGVTLYTAESRGGIPAEFSDPSGEVDPPPIAAEEAQAFAARLAEDLSSREDLVIAFSADWDQMARSEVLRALSCDAMRNAAYALKRLAASGRRSAISRLVRIVRVVQGTRPGVALQRGVLAITVAPQGGPPARPSSFAIARALQAVL